MSRLLALHADIQAQVAKMSGAFDVAGKRPVISVALYMLAIRWAIAFWNRVLRGMGFPSARCVEDHVNVLANDPRDPAAGSGAHHECADTNVSACPGRRPIEPT